MFQFPMIVFVIPIQKWIWKSSKCVLFTLRKFPSPTVMIIELRIVTYASDNKYRGFANFAGPTIGVTARNIYKIVAIHCSTIFISISIRLGFLPHVWNDITVSLLLIVLISVKMPSSFSSHHPAQKNPRNKELLLTGILISKEREIYIDITMLVDLKTPKFPFESSWPLDQSLTFIFWICIILGFTYIHIFLCHVQTIENQQQFVCLLHEVYLAKCNIKALWAM